MGFSYGTQLHSFALVALVALVCIGLGPHWFGPGPGPALVCIGFIGSGLRVEDNEG